MKNSKPIPSGANPIGVISNDWHIDRSNGTQVVELISQKIALAKEIEVDTLICLGDVFNSRNAQPLDSLDTFTQILDLIHAEGMKLICIPGNHDKVNYGSDKSYLDSYAHHPALTLFSKENLMELLGVRIWFIPFYESSNWNECLEQILPEVKKGDLLMSHTAVDGSINNNGELVVDSIPSKLLKPFKAVYLGHYHNHHRISNTNIWHLPSICQRNYGEDMNKGFTILFQDGSFEIIRSKFNGFTTIDLDLDSISREELDNEVKECTDRLGSERIRFRIRGGEDKVKSLPIDKLKQAGFDIKLEPKDIEASIEEVESGEIVEFDSSSILEEFKAFCKNEKFDDIKIGTKYLEEILKKHGKED